MCMALHETFGFGRERLCKLVYDSGLVAKAQDKYEDVSDIVLAKRLRYINMAELADALEESSQKIIDHRGGNE